MFLTSRRSSFSSILVIAVILVPHFIGVGSADTPSTIVGVWSSTYSSSNVSDPTLTPGSMFTIDINATSLPPIVNSTDGGFNAFDITIHYNPLVLNASDADYKAPLCPTVEGCLFDRPEAVPFAHELNSTLGTVRIASALFGTVIDVPGTLFRISFAIIGTGYSAIHIGEQSQLTGPNSQRLGGVGAIPYQPLDGSFDNSPTNLLPQAQFTVTPQIVSVGQQVTFDGSLSSDLDGYITNYSWDFGDGYSATGRMITHSFANPRDYAVTLTVTDDRGGTGTNSMTVSVSPAPNLLPLASFTFNPASPTEDQQVTFDASQSNDPDGMLVQYQWDFGDGYSGSGRVATHSFASAGDYMVTLTVTDDRGGTGSNSLTVTVSTVQNSPPVALFTFNPSSPTVDQQTTFDASQSNDPDGIIVQYHWNFGDTNTATGSQATHSFQSTGNYTVTLTVTDNKGAMASKALTVTVIGTSQSPPLPFDFQTAAVAALALFVIIATLVLITRRRKK